MVGAVKPIPTASISFHPGAAGVFNANLTSDTLKAVVGKVIFNTVRTPSCGPAVFV